MQEEKSGDGKGHHDDREHDQLLYHRSVFLGGHSMYGVYVWTRWHRRTGRVMVCRSYPAQLDRGTVDCSIPAYLRPNISIYYIGAVQSATVT